MPAPYRIYPPGYAKAISPKRGKKKQHPKAIVVVEPPVYESISLYLERLMKMMPAEALSLYLVGAGIIPPDAPRGVLLGWFIFCLGAVVALRVWGTSDKAEHLPVDWVHVVISAVAFIIWVYTMGGPFKLYGIYVEYLGSLLVLGWTFFVPLIYKGQKL